MGWFRRKKVEQRNYTEQRIEAATADATGTGGADANQTAAVQAAAGQWARCFAAAEVLPESPATRAVTPAILYEIGRQFVLCGESVWLLDEQRGRFTLAQASAWDVEGVTAWNYRLTIAGPSGTYVRRVPADQVLHPRINVDPSQPHKGRSSVALAGFTGDLLGGVERGLAREAGANSGYVIAAAIEGMGDADLDALKGDVSGLRGRSMLVPSLAPRAGDPGAGPGRADWQARRIGVNPPEHVVSLRSNVAVAILGAAGIPPALFDSGGDGSGRREAYRMLLHGTIAPVGAMLADVLSEAFEHRVTMNWDRLAAADIQGRARAYRSLVGTEGGIPDDQARKLTGMK